MYLVGLALQGAVLGAVVAAAIVFEEPLRDALDLPAAGELRGADVVQRLEAIETRLDGIAGTLDRMAVAAEESGEARALTAARLAELDEATQALRTSLGERTDEPVRDQLAVLEALLSRVESKVDDVRDAQLFPIPDPTAADDAAR